MNDTKKIVIQKTGEWFLGNSLGKIMGKMEFSIEEINYVPVSMSYIREAGVFVPTCDIYKYTAIKAMYEVYIDNQTEVSFLGSFVLPKRFSKGIRPLYSVRFEVEKNPDVLDFSQFVFPIKKTQPDGIGAYKELIEDIKNFKKFLSVLEKEFAN